LAIKIIKRLALLLVLCFACGSAAFGDDAGPRRDVRAIRHDLLILLAASAPNAVIDSVVVNGDSAVATWTQSGAGWTGTLNRRYDRWWLSKQPRATAGTGVVDDLNFDRPTTLVPEIIYGLTVVFAANDAASQDRVINVLPRAPTLGESWLTPNSDAYAFFSGIVSSAKPIHVQAGTTIDVWFPFVLEPSLRYSLTIDPTVGTPIAVTLPGILAKNTLHFTLPAFTLEPGADLMAEIDGD
jgi:hypothetical protein